jgi:recombinational DNA repair ATPase RecF
MYIRRAIIRNIRSIAQLEWEPEDQGPGWHVILGDNGAGKSSFLRSLALALIGPKEARAARQDWNAWLRSGEDYGFVRIDLFRDDNYDSFSGRGATGNAKFVSAAVRLDRLEESGVEVELEKRTIRTRVSPERHIWGTGAGWSSAAFGPFR